jgi:hypothetical protein
LFFAAWLGRLGGEGCQLKDFGMSAISADDPLPGEDVVSGLPSKVSDERAGAVPLWSGRLGPLRQQIAQPTA